MTVVPTEIWFRIAYYLPPSPVDYVDYALVSTSAKEAFMSDELWRAFTPVHETSDLARKYAKRVGDLSREQLREVRRRWSFFSCHAFTYGAANSVVYPIGWRNQSLDMILPGDLIGELQLFAPEAEALRGNMDFALAMVLCSGHLGSSCLISYGRNEDFIQATFWSVRFIYPFMTSDSSDRLQMWYLSLSYNLDFGFVSDKVLLDYNAYRANPELLCRAPDHTKSDREFVLELMRRTYQFLGTPQWIAKGHGYGISLDSRETLLDLQRSSPRRPIV